MCHYCVAPRTTATIFSDFICQFHYVSLTASLQGRSPGFYLPFMPNYTDSFLVTLPLTCRFSSFSLLFFLQAPSTNLNLYICKHCNWIHLQPYSLDKDNLALSNGVLRTCLISLSQNIMHIYCVLNIVETGVNIRVLGNPLSLFSIL